MRWSLLLMLVVFLSLATGRVSAQYDPNCYFPKVGEPGVIDTIYGSENNQGLSSSINIGPAPGESYGRVLFSGLPQNPPFLTAVSTGPGFDLHKLQTLGPKAFNLNYYVDPKYIRLGHFHSPNYTDILYSGTIIYWSDENGDYDSSRSTILKVTAPDSGFVEYQVIPSYVSSLAQDSVDDIVSGVNRAVLNRPYNLDSTYLVLYRGGTTLYQKGSVAFPDSTMLFSIYDSTTPEYESRHIAQADWRGTGREDLIAGDRHGNLFYYKNDRPFSLSQFVHSMLYDTLLASWQNPWLDSTATLALVSSISLPIFHKNMPGVPKDIFLALSGDTGFSIISGGPNFGSSRWTGRETNYLLHLPTYYGVSVYGYGPPLNCGDMTGTGNNVLFFQGLPAPDGFTSMNFFYVLGDALDDKVDMEFDCSVNHIFNGFAISGGDTLTADGDGLEDVALGLNQYVDDADFAAGEQYVGSIQIVHGSKNIPVRTNGVAATKTESPLLDVYPNPISNIATIEFSNEAASTASVVIRDLLGRTVYETTQTIGAGKQSLKIAVNRLSSGWYRLEVTVGSRHSMKAITILR